MNPALKEFLESIGEKGRQWGGNVAETHVEKLNRQIIAAGEPGDMTGLQLFGTQIGVHDCFSGLLGFYLQQDFVPFGHG